MKHFTLLKTMLTMLCLMVGVGTTWGTAYSGTFNKITAANDLVTGYYVVVGSESASSNADMAMGATVSSGRMTGVAVTFDQVGKTSITNPDNAIVWYVTVSGTTCTFKNMSTSTYLSNSSNTKGGGMSLAAASSNFTFDGYNTTSPIGFKFSSSQSTYKIIKYNTSSKWVSNYDGSYSTSMTPFRMYKLNESNAVKLGTPTGMTSGSITPSSAHLSWNAVSNASSYKVKVGDTEYATSNTYYDLTGLTQVSDYSWSVKAIGDGESYSDGDYCDVVSFTTTANGSTSVIDFESAIDTYTDWTITNLSKSNSNITAYQGSYFGSNGSTTTASITTKNKVLAPQFLKFYVSKTTNNTTACTWTVQVSEDGEEWTDVNSISASSMEKGVWNSLGVDLSSYEDVYVRIYYASSGAARAIDQVTLVYSDVEQAATPVITPADGTEFSTATKEVSISAADGATIYYTLDGTTPNDTKTLYEGAFNISATTTIKAIAYETDKRPSAVASATITYVAPVTNYNINCNAPVGGTYTVKVGNEEAQTVTAATVIDGGEGKTITLTTTPSTGYKLASTPFTVKDADEASVSVSKDGDNYTFTMPSKAVTITANYSPVYAITAADGIVGGTISFTDKDDKAITETSQGSKVNVVVTPDTGYELATLTYNKVGEEPTDIMENKYFTMPGGAVIVTATFSKINYTITYADDLTGGSVSGVATANYGDEVTLTATPDDGWDFNEWNVTSGEDPLTVTENKITMPAADVTVSASFRQFATVTLSENGASTSLAGTHYVGEEVTLPSNTTAAVPAGKTFVGWSEAPIATTNDKPSYLAKGATYTITGTTKTFYAVYATEVNSTYDVVFNVANEADDRSWENGVAYTNVTKSPLTFTVTGGGNNGKYYTSDETWRMYGGTMKVSATIGTTINSVTTTPAQTFEPNDDGSYSCASSVRYTSLTINVTGASIGQYETSVQQKTLASISVTGTPEEFWKGDDFNHNGMTVTASYEEQDVENEDVTAFAEFSTPDMSTAGQKTVTVTYQGKTDTYNIEVLTIANTAETAYTTAQAIAIYDAGKDLTTPVYVTGELTDQTTYYDVSNTYNAYITDGSNTFELYKVKDVDNVVFTSDYLLEGGIVVAYGTLDCYKGTYELADGCYLISYTAPTATITLNAACHADGMVYGTYSNTSAWVVPKNLTVSVVAVDGESVTPFEFNIGDVVPAKTGVLVSASAGGEYEYIVNLSNEAGVDPLEGVYENALRATGNGITADEMAAADPGMEYFRLTMHKGSQCGFWWGAADGAAFELGANKAYLVADPSNFGINGLWFDDDETVVNSVKANVSADEVVYNMAGQKVSSNYKGIVIMNGKKMLNK